MSDIQTKLLEEKIQRALRAKWRFRAIVRQVIQNIPWLIDDSEEVNVDNVKRNVMIAHRGIKLSKFITLKEKSILRKNLEYRTPEEEKHLYKVLGGLKCFRKYPHNVQEKLVATSYFEFYSANRYLMKQRQDAHSMYFLLSGEVSISQGVWDDVTGKEVIVELYKITAGGMFGEVSLLHNEPRITNALTLVPCELLSLKKKDFDRVLKETMKKQWDEILESMAIFPYFDSWSKVWKRECCLLSKIKQFEPNQIIFGDGVGDKGTQMMYFIIEGTALVVEHLWVHEETRQGIQYYKLYNVDDPKMLATDNNSKEKKKSSLTKPSDSKLNTSKKCSLDSKKPEKSVNFSKTKLKEKKMASEKKLVSQQKLASGHKLASSQKLGSKQKLDSKLKLESKQKLASEQKLTSNQKLASNQKLESKQELTSEQRLTSEQKLDSKQNLVSEHKLVSDQKLASEEKIASEQKLGSGQKLTSEQKFELEAGTQLETGTQLEAGTQLEPDTQLEPETQLNPEAELESGQQLESDMQTEPEEQEEPEHQEESENEQELVTQLDTEQTLDEDEEIEAEKELQLSKELEMKTDKQEKQNTSEPDLKEVSELNATDSILSNIDKNKYKANKVLPPGVKIHFMQVCYLGQKSCFKQCAFLNNRRIIAVGPVKCLLIPAYWVLQHNVANIWYRVNTFLSVRVPTTDTVFKTFVDSKKWLNYRKKLREDLLSKRKFPNNTTIHDVPYSIRIVQEYML